MEKIVETKVSAVTVYPDQARVSVRGSVALEEGNQTLIVDELPLEMDKDSVRATGRGTAQIRLLSVDVRQSFFVETPAGRVRDLEKEIEQLEDEIRVFDDELAVLAAQQKYLDGMRLATEQYARGLARGNTTVADQAALGAFLAEQDKELLASKRGLEKEKRVVGRNLDKLRHELTQYQSARPKQRNQARIEIEVQVAGEFTLDLSYVVRKASWRPLYDIRLFSHEGDTRLEVNTIAEITQKTGQEWEGVELTVSTARPALNQRLPELNPWYVDVYHPLPPMPRAVAPPAATTLRAAVPADMIAGEGARLYAESAVAREVEAQVVVAEPQAGETVTQYHVPGKVHVPSDGSPHKTTVSRFQLDPRMDYFAAPKHTDAVFRRATVENKTPGPLLPGQANLFFEGDYIGRTQMEYIPAGDEMELLFGVEERITVERELTRREVDKARLRDKRQLLYGYEIEIKNLLSVAAMIEIHDHIPVSRHEDIKIKLGDVKPQETERSELNLLKWQLPLASNEKLTLSYVFQVEHPRSLKVIGLID